MSQLEEELRIVLEVYNAETTSHFLADEDSPNQLGQAGRLWNRSALP